MAVQRKTTAAAHTDEQYPLLERRPHAWRRQLYLRGRNLPVGTLLWKMRVDQHTPEAAAEDYDIPLEQILEALEYAQHHLDVIAQDEAEERQRLAAAGVIRDTPAAG